MGRPSLLPAADAPPKRRPRRYCVSWPRAAPPVKFGLVCTLT